MFPKIWCFLFGHKRYSDVFTGKYGQEYHPIFLINVRVPIMRKEKNSECPTCGEILK